MKTPVKLITTVAALIILGGIVTKSTVVRAQQAGTAQAPLAVIVNPAPKQYRVFDIGRFPVTNGLTPAGTLEAILNEQGAQGWRVVATSGAFVIMMQ